MWPTLFDSRWLGLDGALHFTIPTYFAAILLGFGLAAWLAWREARTWGIDRQTYVDFALWMLIMGVLGSRLMHVLVDGLFWDYMHLCTDSLKLDGRALQSLEACTSNAQCLGAQRQGQDIGAVCHPLDGLCYPERDCLRWAKFWAGGLTVYGALIASVTFAYFYIRKHKMGFARMADVGGYGIFLGTGLGRLGCLGAGCCYGQVTDSSWGIRFPTSSGAYAHHLEAHYPALVAQWSRGVEASLAVWPTQLIDSVYNLLIFAFAYFVVRPRKRFHGQVLLTSAILYAVCRFLIESLRDDFRGEYLGLSTSQLVSAPIIVGATIWLVVLLRRAKRGAPAPEPA